MGPTQLDADDYAPQRLEESLGAPLHVRPEVLEAVERGEDKSPHAVLGPHLNRLGHVSVRTLQRDALAINILTKTEIVPMAREHGDIWVGLLEAKEIGRVPDYRVQRIEPDGVRVVDDPYRHTPRLGEMELHRIRTGGVQVQELLLGAHPQHYSSPMGEVEGTGFVVKQDEAVAVRVCGDFNIWNGSSHAMRKLGNSGIWEIFIPGVAIGAKYRFEYLEPTGTWVEYADPVGHYSTEDPDTICVVQPEGFEA
ncbi:hypothetical protein GCM10009715_11430 [Paeniglutamicibacter psychrophenolicus]|uniref:Glycoside hydrolase family 13 N-terminal domain-containing protein n=1 Tax=Paeniglutamicibacter psychrophenolicus TaxID=257454 RepID=A0ABS4W7A8_9MICC|nr:hypothetical protein [Paeniglutamicibacter psychrophenolicus]MBP2372092.1 hypothetical protein [Paeniglutamicibacter psychrophenolicus]